ncbi:MAG: T9SS type A sorting domain-containing protein [Ferruginibacter sp.]
MKKTLLLLFIIALSFPGFSQITYSGTLSNTDPFFNRPDEGTPPTMLSTDFTHVYYQVITFTVTTPGFITITSSSTYDNFGILYGPAGFDPNSPLTNALTAVDDQSGTNFGFTYQFTSAGTYYLVFTSFKNNVTGSFAVTINPVITIPVKLVSFTAEKNKTSGNLIKWSTAEEINIEKYEVLRSTDGKNFDALAGAELISKNSSANTSYSFTDAAPISGINYYRLKITEKGGKSSVGSIASVNNRKGGAGTIRLYPNPTINFLNVDVKSSSSGKATVTIVNSGGETVFTKEYRLNNQAVLSVDVKRIPAGKYFVKTIIDNEESVASFIKD